MPCAELPNPSLELCLGSLTVDDPLNSTQFIGNTLACLKWHSCDAQHWVQLWRAPRSLSSLSSLSFQSSQMDLIGIGFRLQGGAKGLSPTLTLCPAVDLPRIMPLPPLRTDADETWIRCRCRCLPRPAQALSQPSPKSNWRGYSAAAHRSSQRHAASLRRRVRSPCLWCLPELTPCPSCCRHQLRLQCSSSGTRQCVERIITPASHCRASPSSLKHTALPSKHSRRPLFVRSVESDAEPGSDTRPTAMGDWLAS